MKVIVHPHLDRIDRAISVLLDERRRFAGVRPAIAFQGVAGAFSEDAATVIGGAESQLVGCRTLDDVFVALSSGAVDYAVVPVENSIAGPVPRARQLIRTHRAQILAEHAMPIVHALIGVPGATIDDLRRVTSHPVALAQCGRFLAAHPKIAPQDAFDTAGAVELIVKRGDRAEAAIASARAAHVHGGHVLARGVQDRDDNVTTFVLVSADGAFHKRDANFAYR